MTVESLKKEILDSITKPEHRVEALEKLIALVTHEANEEIERLHPLIHEKENLINEARQLTTELHEITVKFGKIKETLNGWEIIILKF